MPEARDFEQEARVQGWKPQNEFEGDQDKWVDAETFVKRGEQSLGIWKDRFEKVERRLSYQEQINNDLKAQYKRFEAAKQKEIDGLIKQLEDTRKRAISQGDGEAFDKAERELNKLKEERIKTVAVQEEVAQTPPPWAQEWMQDNPWYGKDMAMTAIAEEYSRQLRQASPYLTERQFLDQVAEYVKVQMPHKFENANKKKNPDVEIDGGRGDGGTSSNAKTYANLPPEAKKECNRLMKEGIIKDRNEYATIYFADEE